MNSKISTRIKVLCWAFLLAILLPAFTLVPMVNAQSSSAASTREVQWIITIQESCLNPSFCNPTGGMFTEQISATFFSDHTAPVTLIATGFDNSGHINYRVMEKWNATWKTGPGTGGPNDFILSGTNTTAIYMNGHQHTTVQKFLNYDTGSAAKQVVLNCAQFLGVPKCPSDVSGILSITHVS